jgi:putative nucleotidyltransferase with HDIG domain
MQPILTLTPEEIESNFNKYRSFFEKLGDRAEQGVGMVDALGERLALCPASGRKDYHNSFPGGLVEHSLRVLGNAIKLSRAFEWKIPKESLIIGALLHDIGKVGDENEDYYVAAEQWRQEKQGELYTYSSQISYMSVPDRSVYLCQHYNLILTKDEFLAIKLNDGWVVNENKPYCLKEPMLAHVVMTADYISTMQEKGMLP